MMTLVSPHRRRQIFTHRAPWVIFHPSPWGRKNTPRSEDFPVIGCSSGSYKAPPRYENILPINYGNLEDRAQVKNFVLLYCCTHVPFPLAAFRRRYFQPLPCPPPTPLHPPAPSTRCCVKKKKVGDVGALLLVATQPRRAPRKHKPHGKRRDPRARYGARGRVIEAARDSA